jgi:2-dehydropantoate 2-reductase
VREAPLGRLLLERAVREALTVGAARGARLAPDVEAGILSFIDGLPPATKPSFLLDLEAGRQTELEHLSGAIARLGRLSGVPTPVHDVCVAALSVRR